MAENDNRDLVTVALRRSKLTLEGKFLDFVKSDEIINLQKFLNAAMAFYLPYYLLEFSEGSEKDKMLVLECVAELEMQAIKIKRLHNMENLSQVYLIPGVASSAESAESPHAAFALAPAPTPKKEIDEDDDDDDPISAALEKINIQTDWLKQ